MIKKAIYSILKSLCILSSGWIMAQPSGGPYGPMDRVYELPETEGRIYYASPDGDVSSDGSTLASPTTLESAISKVVTGDAIVMRGGTYRTGDLILNQGITIQPYRDEQPVVSGAWIASDWEPLQNGLWRTRWSRLFPARPAGWWNREQNLRFTPLHRFNNDMVFIDGRILQSAGGEDEVDENSFFVDYDRGLIYIGINPEGRLIEITAHDAALIRTTGMCHGKQSDGRGPRIRGISFTRYAYRAINIEGSEGFGPTDESRFGKEVVGTLLEDCSITCCSRVAAYLRGDSLVVRRCRISDTSTEGLYIVSSNDVLLEKNIFERNNIERITGYYPAAVKIFNQSHRVTCMDNLVTDHPYSNGIWYDVGNVDGVFLNNHVRNVGSNLGAVSHRSIWPAQNGFFFEISKGAICAGNLFENCDHGILLLNSCNVRIYNNTLVNSMLVIARDERSAVGDRFGWHPSTGPDVDEREGHVLVNNLLVSGSAFQRPLLMVWQPRTLCERLNEPQTDRVDHNVYITLPGRPAEPLILWSPWDGDQCQAKLSDPMELNRIRPALSANSVFLDGYEGPLFADWPSGDYRLPGTLPGVSGAGPVPEEIPGLPGYPGRKDPYVGAYPVIR